MLFDNSVLLWFYKLYSSSLLFKFLALLFSKYIPYFLFIFLIFFLFKIKDLRQRLLFFLYFLFGILVSNLFLAKILNYLIYRRRPFEDLNLEPIFRLSGSSFPSFYVSLFSTLTFILFLIYSRKLAIFFGLGTILIGIGEMLGSVSWFSDILGGILVGFITFLIFKYLFFNQKLYFK